MQLISAIEIRYLRSVYHARLADLSSVNILSGTNDSGKSNILKALNLFFNGHVDWQSSITFYRDFSATRLEEVRKESIKGKQYISITLEFVRPESYKGSLPSTFKVTRTWLRDSTVFTESNNLEALHKAGKIPTSIGTARRSLSKFLNRVHYEYIPAVKDRAYFEHLLSRLQSTLLAAEIDPSMSQVTDTLAKDIQGKIIDLRIDFGRATGITSAIEPPKEFASLFRAFQVTTVADRANISLSLRGDGIQARFIPSVLYYISMRSSDFFIWGFEEPENSLEYSKVVELATDFLNLYPENAQIFITTHSPAFTTLRGDDSTCSRIYCDNGRTNAIRVWPKAKDPFQLEQLNQEMGFFRIQEQLHEEYVKNIQHLQDLQTTVKQLNNEIARNKMPLVLTEGVYDIQILQAAWRALRSEIPLPFLIRSADPAFGATPGGSGGAQSLAKTIETIHPGDGRKTIAVFDRDVKGKKCFDSLSANFFSWNGKDDIKVHVNGLAYALLIPIPQGRESEAQYQALTIEFFFPDDVLILRTSDGRGLTISTPSIQSVVVAGRSINLGRENMAISLDQIFGHQIPFRVITDGKDVFAEEIVPSLPSSAFNAFESLFQIIEQILR